MLVFFNLRCLAGKAGSEAIPLLSFARFFSLLDHLLCVPLASLSHSLSFSPLSPPLILSLSLFLRFDPFPLLLPGAMLTARRTTWAAVADVEVDLDAAPSSTALGSPPPPQRLRPTSPSPSRSQSPAQSASVPLLSLQPAIPALLSALGEPELAHATSGDEREGLLQIIRRLAQHSPELQRSVARNALPTLLALLRSPVSAANLVSSDLSDCERRSRGRGQKEKKN